MRRWGLASSLVLSIGAAACGNGTTWPGPGPLPTSDPNAPPPGLAQPSMAPPPATSSVGPAATSPRPTAAPAPQRSGPRATGILGPEAVAAWDALPSTEKNKVRAAKVFFGHQSVGANTLEGVEALGFTVQEIASASDYATPKIGHAYLESNTEPLRKLQSFERFLGRIGGSVQVAAMKLCWIDFEASTNLGTIETRYETTIAALKSSSPTVTFLHITPPIKTDEPAVNAKRLQFGDWLKSTYKNEAIVLDLAVIQSTRVNGSVCASGATRVMCSEYASDEGHLNAQGQARAAKGFLYAVYKSL
jgi:hypothetical protein